MASVDHCLWFHEPFWIPSAEDDGVIYVLRGMRLAQDRGLSMGRMYVKGEYLMDRSASEMYVHVLTCVQEGVLRLRSFSKL